MTRWTQARGSRHSPDRLTIIFVTMLFPPERSEPADFFSVLATWRAGVFDLLASLAVLAIVMLKFIRQHDHAVAGQPAR